MVTRCRAAAGRAKIVDQLADGLLSLTSPLWPGGSVPARSPAVQVRAWHDPVRQRVDLCAPCTVTLHSARAGPEKVRGPIDWNISSCKIEKFDVVCIKSNVVMHAT
jgi:hypothetical protein